MSKIKLCGLSRPCDITAANKLLPDYIGFVFARESKRFISRAAALELKSMLDPVILAVGVYVNEAVELVAEDLNRGLIDLAQLHGNEDEEYIRTLQSLAGGRQIIRAFRIRSEEDVRKADSSIADHILLDSGTGSGNRFNWEYLKDVHRPYFLAGGLDPENVGKAVSTLHPMCVDVSSGIETDGKKDIDKMLRFVMAVRLCQETDQT